MSNNYQEIYELLELLCKSLIGDESKEAIKHVTNYISDCTTVNSKLLFNESNLLTKILNELRQNNSSENDVTLFMSTYEKLKACETNEHRRSKFLTFIYSILNLNEKNTDMQSNGFLNAKTPSKVSKNTSDLGQNSTESLNTIVNSIRSEFYSNGCNVNSTNSINKSSKPFTSKLIYSQNKKTSSSSSSENNLKVTPLKRSLSAQSHSSDSSSSLSSLRDYKQPVATTANSNELPNNNDLTEDIVQNVIFSFTGIEGKYLKKDIITGNFKLNSKAWNLNMIQSGMLMRLSELGYYHDQIQSFTDPKSGKCALGLMGQGFVSALKNELTKYYGMVAMLQEQLNKQKRRNAKEWNDQSNVENITLMKVMVWAFEPLQRLQWIATIAEACQEKKGGALASTVYEFLNNGDPLVKSLARELLIAICAPLIQMLLRWILEGEIIDPFNEFFIECLHEVKTERLWHDKYRVRNNMLPIFISTDFANKILVTGKSINFLREVCENKTPVKGREELNECFQTNSESIFSNTADTKLHSIIDSVYLSTSKKVLDIVIGPHKLLDHLHAMRRYLLLGQGDFIGVLLESLKSELDKPGKELYSYDISSIMYAAIRSTSAQYDDPEILNHLDVRLLQPFDGDNGWDILSLKYTVRGPLSTMLEPSMNSYQIIFKPLWRMKHIEFLLSSKIWKDQMCNSKPLRPLNRELNPIMYRLNLYTSEMIHFINQVQYYILFEVIECSWAEFLENVQAAKALDDILYAHDEFLEKIKIGAFLDAKSKDLSLLLNEVYLCVTRLELWQDRFYEICFKELYAQKDYKDSIEKSEISGEYGVTTEKRLKRDEEYKMFEHLIGNCHDNLKKLGNEYENSVRQFLLALNSSNDMNLQLFGIRLDFNEYYKKRDQRLCVPLTFEHMRMSNVFYNSRSNSMNTSRCFNNYNN